MAAEHSALARVPAIAAAVVAAVGALTLAGWVFDVAVLKSMVPGLVAMKANTALCFLLVAAALWLVRVPSQGRHRAVAVSLASTVGLIAVLTIVEYLLGQDLGIDELLVDEPTGATGTSHPGRMAPNTAVAFLFVAGALAALDLRWRMRGWLSAGLALGAGVLALVALVGYVSGVTSLYAVSHLTQMAVPTGVAFLLLTAGVTCARQAEGPMRLLFSDTTGGTVMRALFPMLLAVPIVLGMLRLAGEHAAFYDTETGTWLFAISIIAMLTALTWALAASLDRAEQEGRRARAARREAQLERAAFDEAPIGSAHTDLDGRFTRVNRAFCEMTGYTPAQLVGMSFVDLTHPADRPESADGLVALVDGSASEFRSDKRYVHRDGRVIYVRVAVTSIYDEAGQLSTFYSQIEDVTERTLAARRVEQAQFETLARLAAAAEYRDDDTGEHTRRVGDMAAQLAEALGLPADFVALIRLAAPLHDVGKIGIPDAILLKPGRLTPEEFDEMKRHTTIGAEMLSGGTYPQLALAEQIALTHHERWDGTGYPNGLAGEAIPLAGRIVAVADVFDALTHPRPYKSAWPVEQALAELRRQRGRQFDPDVIDAFALLGDTQPARLLERSGSHALGDRDDPGPGQLRATGVPF